MSRNQDTQSTATNQQEWTETPDSDGNREVATELVRELRIRGTLAHRTAIDIIRSRFGRRYIRRSPKSGLPVVKKRVLEHFRRIAAGAAWWQHGRNYWRWRPRNGNGEVSDAER